jgi:hypothetical protein
MSKETYFYGKRDLFLWQKTPISMAKEAYFLFLWQKRPISVAKEAYFYGKRGLPTAYGNIVLTHLRDDR